jgi:hypothetical protein
LNYLKESKGQKNILAMTTVMRLGRACLGEYAWKPSGPHQHYFDCEERRGEERTGHDRTWHDRTGHDRTGQDRTGEERRGQDRTVEERRGEERRGEERSRIIFLTPKRRQAILWLMNENE